MPLINGLWRRNNRDYDLFDPTDLDYGSWGGSTTTPAPAATPTPTATPTSSVMPNTQTAPTNTGVTNTATSTATGGSTASGAKPKSGTIDWSNVDWNNFDASAYDWSDLNIGAWDFSGLNLTGNTSGGATGGGGSTTPSGGSTTSGGSSSGALPTVPNVTGTGANATPTPTPPPTPTPTPTGTSTTGGTSGGQTTPTGTSTTPIVITPTPPAPPANTYTGPFRSNNNDAFATQYNLDPNSYVALDPTKLNNISAARQAVQTYLQSINGRDTNINNTPAIETYAQKLAKGEMTWDQVVSETLTSSAVTGRGSDGMVNEWYQSVLGRNATPEELTAWRAQSAYTPAAEMFTKFMHDVRPGLDTQLGTGMYAIQKNQSEWNPTKFDPHAYLYDPDNADLLQAFKNQQTGGMSETDFANYHYNTYGAHENRNWDGKSAEQLLAEGNRAALQTKVNSNPAVRDILASTGVLKADGTLDANRIQDPSIKAMLSYQLGSGNITTDALANYIANLSGDTVEEIKTHLGTYFGNSINPQGVFANAEGTRTINSATGTKVLTPEQGRLLTSLLASGSVVEDDQQRLSVMDAKPLLNQAVELGATANGLAGALGIPVRDLMTQMSSLGFTIGAGGKLVAPKVSANNDTQPKDDPNATNPYTQMLQALLAQRNTPAPTQTTPQVVADPAQTEKINKLQALVDQFSTQMKQTPSAGRNVQYYQRPQNGRRFGSNMMPSSRRANWGSTITF